MITRYLGVSGVVSWYLKRKTNFGVITLAKGKARR